jgi:hypothetical protein
MPKLDDDKQETWHVANCRVVLVRQLSNLTVWIRQEMTLESLSVSTQLSPSAVDPRCGPRLLRQTLPDLMPTTSVGGKKFLAHWHYMTITQTSVTDIYFMTTSYLMVCCAIFTGKHRHLEV